MAAGSGRNFNLYVGDGATPQVFNPVGSFRTTEFSRNGEPIDTTTKDSAGDRELLEGGGIRSASVSGAGVIKDTAVEERMRTAYETQSVDRDYEVHMPSGAVYGFKGQLTQFSFNGEFNGAAEYSIALESNGAVSYTPAP